VADRADAGQGGAAHRGLVARHAPTNPPQPVAPLMPARWMYRLHRMMAPNRTYRRLANWLEVRRRPERLFTAAESLIKEHIFGCRMCGQCAIPITGYACPMTCPKQLRNGPCGGVGQDGSCEVYSQLRCVWLTAIERATSQGHCADLLLVQRPVDHRLWGQSAWIGYWQERDELAWTDPA